MPQISQSAIKELLALVSERRSEHAQAGTPSQGLASIQQAFESLMAKEQGSNLFWVKPTESEQVAEPVVPVLASLGSVGTAQPGKPAHVLIEGDNFPTLQVLKHTHRASIDVIYIDPPYNTRESGFKYNDNWVDGENKYRHSMWLSFMEKRIQLALELLKPTGALLISIDDNEYSQLKLLCDSLIGQDHFHGNVTWHKRTKPVNSGKAKYGLQVNVEYILVYSKQAKQSHPGFKLKIEGERVYPHTYKGATCRFENLLATDHGRKKRDTMKFPILGVCPPVGKRWQIGETQAREYELADKVTLVEGVPKLVVYPGDEPPGVEKPFWSHFPLDTTGTAQSGKALLASLVGEDHGFDTVKPLELMTQLLSHFPEDAVVLDFFAGSGTTAHAVLELNRSGGSRQCILVTDNSVDKTTQAALEKEGHLKGGSEWQARGICRSITWPRVSAVVDGRCQNGKTDWASAPLPERFEYFKLEVQPLNLVTREVGEQFYSEADKAEARVRALRESRFTLAHFSPIAWLEAGAQSAFDSTTAELGHGAGFAVVKKASDLPAGLDSLKVVYLLSDSVVDQPGASLSPAAARVAKKFSPEHTVKIKELWIDYVKNFPVEAK